MAATAVLQHALDPAALRRARLATGLTIYDVGIAIGRAGPVVSRYETGHIDPPSSIVAALASLYGVDPGTFFTTQ